jgi:putative nucleotidyltransferase with HDIG domain
LFSARPREKISRSIAVELLPKECTRTMLGFRKAERMSSVPDPSQIAEAIADVARQVCRDTQVIKQSLPNVAAEVMALCQQSSTDALRVEKSVTRDPFISAQIVSVSNSPMFAPRMPIVSVRDAIVRIGLSNVSDIVMMVVTSSTMFRIRGFDEHVSKVTSRFPATALAARMIATALKLPSEAAFTAGLLHDIGDLILLDRCVTLGKVRPEMLQEPVFQGVIMDALHAHHTKVGAAACTAWKLPASTVEAASHHHDYKLGGHHYSANLVAAADAFADNAGIGVENKRVLDPAEAVFKDLGLKSDQLTATLVQFGKLLPSVRIFK